MKNLLIFLLAIFLVSCGPAPKHHHYKEKVHCYKVYNSHSNDDNIWIYYYVLLMDNNSCYYTTSSRIISDFSETIWQLAKENPMEKINEEIELPEEELALENLPEEMQEEIDNNPDEFNEATSDEINVEGETSTEADADVDAGDSGGDAGDGGGGDD